MLKWLGAAGICLACAGVGFSMARELEQQERLLGILLHKLGYIYRQLHYRATPLPELLLNAAGEEQDPISAIFRAIPGHLHGQNGQVAMEDALQTWKNIPEAVKTLLSLLGGCMGAFDLDGQLSHLESVMEECKRSMAHLAETKQIRLRNYRTMGICAGAAITILLL